jgi:hypothetical protein
MGWKMRDRNVFIINDVIYRIRLDGTKAAITVSFPPWANVVRPPYEQHMEVKGIELENGRIVDPPGWLPRALIDAFEEAQNA